MAKRNKTISSRTPAATSIVFVGTRRASVRLHPIEFTAIDRIAKIERCFKQELYAHIDSTRKKGISLTAAIRVFILNYFLKAETEEGHRLAGHGELIKTKRKHR